VGGTLPERADELGYLKLITDPIAKITERGGWGKKKVLMLRTRGNGGQMVGRKGK
jgi:hypothetical protein